MQTCPYDGRPILQPHVHAGVIVMAQPEPYRPVIQPMPRRPGQPPKHLQDVRDGRAIELAVWAFAAAYPMYVIHG